MGWIGRIGVLAVVGSSSVARASVIAAESFSYTQAQSVAGQSGGGGWATPWISGQSSGFVAAAAIAGAPVVGQTGGSMQVTASGRIFRRIDLGASSPAASAGLVQSHTATFFGTIDGIGKPGTTVWIGVLVSGGSASAGIETQYHLYDGAKTDATSLALGDQNKDGEAVAMLRGGNVAQWGFERTCNHSQCATGAAEGYWASNPAVPFGGTHWSVARFVFKATTTEITMWRDPAAGAVDPADNTALALTPFSGGTAVQTTIVPALFFDTIAPNASGNYNYFVDEIRIATTFADLSNGASPPPVDGAPDAGLGPDGPGGVADNDAGTGTPGAGSGCGCASSTAPRSSEIVIAFVALALRRRRRSTIAL